MRIVLKKLNLLSTNILLLSFVFLTPSVLTASHIVGGEMTYKFIKRDTVNTRKITYHFTLKIYRDIFSTNGTGLDNPIKIATYLQRANGSYPTTTATSSIRDFH